MTYEPIDAEWLKAQLTETVLKGNWHVPRKALLEELASKLNALEPHIRRKNVTANLSSDLKEVVKAVNIINRLTPNMVRGCLTYYENSRVELYIKRFQNAQAQMTGLINECIYEGMIVVSLSNEEKNTQKWQPFAFTIANYFISALSKANPNRPIGYSTGGPVSKFVHVVAPRLTKEYPALESVSKKLKQDARHFKAMSIDLDRPTESGPSDDSESPF